MRVFRCDDEAPGGDLPMRSPTTRCPGFRFPTASLDLLATVSVLGGVAGVKRPRCRVARNDTSSVLWAMVRADGTHYFYDPQTGRKVVASAVGPFQVYSVAAP